jgi:hypothetical protein
MLSATFCAAAIRAGALCFRLLEEIPNGDACIALSSALAKFNLLDGESLIVSPLAVLV